MSSGKKFALSINEVNLERLKDKDCGEAERLALALVLAQSGMSVAESARTVGVGVHKVWNKIAPHVSRDEKGNMLEELALDASIHLSLEIMERINDGSIRSSEVVRAAQVMTNIVARKQRWDAPTPTETEEKEKTAMERLLEALEKSGKVVTVEAKEGE